MKDNVMEEVKRIFKPEFLNRIDEIIVFHALGKEEVHEIVQVMLKEIIKRFCPFFTNRKFYLFILCGQRYGISRSNPSL